MIDKYAPQKAAPATAREGISIQRDVGRLQNLAISDTGFIFDPSTGDSFVTNPVGLEVIRLLKQGYAESAIKDAIFEGYDAPLDEIEDDISDFMRNLTACNLISE
jgi:hypothetical protein